MSCTQVLTSAPSSAGASPASEPAGIVHLREGRSLRLRPVRPDDEAGLVEMVERSSPEDVRLRFMSPIRPHLGALSSRLANVDPRRHIAIAAYDPDSPRGDREILGVVRLVRAEGDRTGEFAVMVRSDMKGQCLGYGLMREILHRAEEIGLAGVEGEILPENRTMRRLVRDLGGRVLPSDGYFRSMRVRFDLPLARDFLAASGGAPPN